MIRTLSIVLLFVANAAAECELLLNEPKPIVVKRFGSKTAIIKQSVSQISMSVNETTTFHCPTGIIVNTYDRVDTNLNVETSELHCTQDGIFLDAFNMLQQESIQLITCNKDFRQSLYESNTSLVGCNAGAMTLLVGYRLQGMHDVKLLGMCYDLSEMRLRFVSFLAHTPRNLLLEMHTEHELNDLHLDTYIASLNSYLPFLSQSQFQQLISSQQHQQFPDELFKPNLFEYASLLENAQKSHELSDYNDMLSIVWLSSLRAGNWQNFLRALHAARDNGDAGIDANFDMRLGVSGVATLPPTYNSNANRSLQITGSVDGRDQVVPIPKHIWAHVRSLQPTGNVDDEFVVVAHNSPYANVLELSTFCTDICDQIPWLRNTLFGQLHLMPSYGVMHCCRLDQLDKLTDFPHSKLSQTQPPPPPPLLAMTTTTTPSTLLL